MIDVVSHEVPHNICSRHFAQDLLKPNSGCWPLAWRKTTQGGALLPPRRSGYSHRHSQQGQPEAGLEARSGFDALVQMMAEADLRRVAG